MSSPTVTSPRFVRETRTARKNPTPPQVSLTQVVVVPTETSPSVVSVDLPIMSGSLSSVQMTQISTHFSLISSSVEEEEDDGEGSEDEEEEEDSDKSEAVWDDPVITTTPLGKIFIILPFISFI